MSEIASWDKFGSIGSALILAYFSSIGGFIFDNDFVNDKQSFDVGTQMENKILLII